MLCCCWGPKISNHRIVSVGTVTRPNMWELFYVIENWIFEHNSINQKKTSYETTDPHTLMKISGWTANFVRESWAYAGWQTPPFSAVSSKNRGNRKNRRKIWAKYRGHLQNSSKFSLKMKKNWGLSKKISKIFGKKKRKIEDKFWNQRNFWQK